MALGPRTGGRISRLAVPLKAWLHRFAFILLMIGAAVIFAAGKADILLVERARIAIVDAVSPVIDVLSRPVAAVSETVRNIKSLSDLYAENARLREENRRLLHWQQLARKLDQENARFRRLLAVRPEPRTTYITGRVFADKGGPFVRTLLVNAGARDGVSEGFAAVTEDGLIGMVAEVGERVSRILLITDLNARIPVVIEGSRQRAILAGDNSPQPVLAFLAQRAQIAPGDRVVTSGDGGVLPPGWPVGIVASLHEGVARVQPFADWNRLEYVTLLRYRMPPMVPLPQEEDGAEEGSAAMKADKKARKP